jgi:hypothetical protein
LRRTIGLAGINILNSLIACSLAISVSTGEARAQDAGRGDSAEARLLKCIEATEKRLAEGTLECVGKEANDCRAGRMEPPLVAGCYAAERTVWERIMQKALDEQLSQLSKDEEGRKSRGAEPLLPSLKLAHELWQKSADADCAFIFQLYFGGTERSQAQEYCKLVRVARRTYFYRNPIRP